MLVSAILKFLSLKLLQAKVGLVGGLVLLLSALLVVTVDRETAFSLPQQKLVFKNKIEVLGALYAFLCSYKAGNITSQNITIEGGQEAVVM